ncbi:dimethylsulfoxide reductase, chain B [Ferrimonas balearica DSM 9799]|uniref:Dimethylsulfoxide reductase, chain B n=1 Tax=Ferrimonas balearica (strain DSM 9799 / CCM 4581 / KCTC 23876 / PAT) TaxID=550540 RepID=E1SNK4_FERBD|nr:dimethylsulfoxide reductase, chain B [Ferrimonas balearica DSM 9799]
MMEKTTQQYGFYFDASRCSGCKACHVACKDRMNAPEGVIPRRVYEYSGGGFIRDEQGAMTASVFSYYTSVGCNHCSHPVCVKACPTGACHKSRSTGLVSIDRGVCIGCASCARACPYDAPQLNQATGTMMKCDGCADRLAEGKAPICVAACPMRALDFGPMDELKQRYPHASIAAVAPLPDPGITSPNLLIGANANAQPSGSTLGRVTNEREV